MSVKVVGVRVAQCPLLTHPNAYEYILKFARAEEARRRCPADGKEMEFPQAYAAHAFAYLVRGTAERVYTICTIDVT